MKNRILLVCLLVSLSGYANTRTATEAMQVAGKAMSQIHSCNDATMAALRRSATSESMRLVMTQNKYQSNEPALYLFNTQRQNSGFVIVSADDRIEPILGFADEGSLDAEDIPTNLQFWLDMYAEEIANLPANYKATDSSKTYTAVQPLLTSTWGQDAPYNIFCRLSYDSTTAAPTGCVATAVAQVMNFWKYPVHSVCDVPYWKNVYSPKDTSYIPASDTYYDWANMLDDYAESSTPAQDTAVAKLMSHIGRAAKMVYDKSSSSASTVNAIEPLFRYFAYDAGIRVINKDYANLGYMLDQIAAELATGRPIVMDGSKSKREGHAFVCDGIREDGYLHINWGWEGDSDGYFRLSVLNPDAEGTGGSAKQGGLGYSTMDCNVYLGIQPEKGGEWIPHFTDNSETIRTTRVARTSDATVNILYVKIDWTPDLMVQPCVVLWQNDSIVNTYSFDEKYTADYKHYKNFEYTSIPTSQFPAGEYKMQFGMQVDGFTGVVPLYQTGVGETQYDVTVTDDSVFIDPNEQTIELRIKVDTSFTENVSQGFKLYVASNTVSATLQSDGWYKATVSITTAVSIKPIANNESWSTYNTISGVTESGCYILKTEEEASGRSTITRHYIYPYEGDCPTPATTKTAYMPEVITDTVRYTVTTEGDYGTVSGAGSYIKGRALFLYPKPDEDYEFERWEDGSIENPRMVIVDHDIHAKALFKRTEASLAYILRDQTTHEKIVAFDMSNPALLVADVQLTQDTNRVEITQYINAYSTAWYGPYWEGYKSSLSDQDGYCWWTCPEFDATNKITAAKASGSGTNNHIGMIIPKGTYRFSFDYTDTANNLFILEKQIETDTEQIQTDCESSSIPCVKIILNGHLYIRCGEVLYDMTGNRLQ